MKHHTKRLTALCLCLALLVGLIPALAPATTADAAMYTSYTTIAKIGTHGGCNAMQGMDVDGSYIYCAKINSETETTCSIGRIHKTTGETVWLTNSATGTYYFSQLAHANDLAVCTINGVKTLFVGTGGAGKGDYSLVRFSFNGTTLKEVGHYNMKHSGSEKYIAGVKVVATSPTEFTLVLKQGNHVYTAKIPYSTTSGDIAMNYLGKLDFSAVNFGGTIKDLSNYVQQGFGYKDNKLFVPMTANYQTSTSHISTIVCFDIDGMKGGNLKPDPNMSVWIEDTTYPDLFEIESCAICPTDGKLYFGTNCRKSSTDGNHDGVHVLNSFVYSPAMGDQTTGQNYYFHTSSNKLQSVTTANSVFNSALQHLGTVSGNKISGGRWSIDMPIILKHDEPWIVTWEGSNWTGNGMLLSTYDTSPYPNNYYLYRCAGSSLVALGYYSGGSYHNYGVDLSKHGIDDTVSHRYQLKNVVNADGTNMVYLWVDGTNLGAMNNYHFGSTSQGKTVNWVSGKDFSFSYIGTAQYPISGTLKHLKVWTQGNINAFDEPSIFRWETQNDKMTPISQFGYTTNPVTVLGGSCTDGTYSGYYDRLEQPVVLMHDRPWVMEWKTPSWSGNTMLFSSGDTAWKLNASYLYRSTEIVAFGYSDGANAHSYGIKLSDHGLSATAGHTYRLTNKLEADGSNMVYLSVDGQELGPMDRYHLGNDYQGVTSDFVSGKDFTFPYMGNYHYGLNQAYEYIQVWENGIPADDTPDRFRWEPSGSSFKNITTDGHTPNSANRVVGTLSGGVFNEATYRLDTPIVLQHDRPWSVSWRSSGTWSGSAGGAFLLSASQVTNQTNVPYLYRRKDSGMIGFGVYNGTRHVQYGLQLSDFGIDGTADHTYTLTNRIGADGSNMVYLSVDGVELGAMNNYFIGADPQGTTSDWLSGKDFTFRYIGTPRFPLSNITLAHLEVDEGGHTHSFGPWTVTQPATCTAEGTQQRTCSGCSDTETQTVAATGHNYETTVVAPDCTNTGHTTYTCTACGDSYLDSTTPATGHSYQATVVPPACTTEGYTSYTCTTCGDSYQDSTIAATGHSFVSGSCTSCGQACVHEWASNVCTICRMSKPQKDYYLFGWIDGKDYACEDDYENLGEYGFVDGKLTAIFKQDSYVAVKSHDNQDWYMASAYLGESITAATLFNTNSGANEKLFVPGGKVISFTLKDNGDDSFTLSYVATACPHASHDANGICPDCGHTVAHSYSGGTCTICGAEDPNAVTDPGLTLNYPTLSFEDEIIYNVYFSVADTSSVVEMGLMILPKMDQNATIDDAVTLVPGYVTNGVAYLAKSEGVPAANMGDTLYFKVYAKLTDGSYAYSSAGGYNAKAYSNSILKGNNSEEMKALVVSMLNYGAEAQLYFQHNTDKLVNNALTAEQQALVKAYDTTMMDAIVKADTNKTADFVRVNSNFKSLYPSVSFDGAFAINFYCTPAIAVDGDMTLYYWDMETMASMDKLSVSNATGSMVMEPTGGMYWGQVAGIAAKQMDKTYYVTCVFESNGETITTGVIPYSLGKYCSDKAAADGDAQQAFAQATAVYGYYAKNYFASIA